MASERLEKIGKALAYIPSGCAVITCASAGTATGMLVSWVQQAAFEPPMVSVAIKRGRTFLELLRESGRFTLNLVAAEADVLMKRFAAGPSPADDPFAGLEATPTPHGVELAEAVARLACETRNQVEAGDHVLFLAEVVAGDADTGRKPRVHIRKTGLSY